MSRFFEDSVYKDASGAGFGIQVVDFAEVFRVGMMIDIHQAFAALAKLSPSHCCTCCIGSSPRWQSPKLLDWLRVIWSDGRR